MADNIRIFSGEDEIIGSVDIYSEATNSFMEPTNLSAPRTWLTGAGNNDVIVFAGGDGDFDNSTAEFWDCIGSFCVGSHVDVYNLKTEEWERPQALSVARFVGLILTPLLAS